MRYVISMALMCFILCSSTLFSQEYRAEYVLPHDDASIAARWSDLDQAERDRIAMRNLHGLVRAMHKYHDVHGTLPPSEIPNSNLPPEKRLSGFVLLLPYLDEATYLWNGEEGPKIFDSESSESAKRLYRSIDLSKAWDDPMNLDAAKTLVPALLLPGVKTLRDENGLAISHVAFVRGLDGNDNGAFTSEPKRINEITDGTANTLAIGQINKAFGPWIAAGNSTSRFLYIEASLNDDATFGSSKDAGCFFANLDSHPYFLDLAHSSLEFVRALTTAAGGELIEESKLARFDGVKAWEENRNK